MSKSNEKYLRKLSLIKTPIYQFSPQGALHHRRAGRGAGGPRPQAVPGLGPVVLPRQAGHAPAPARVHQGGSEKQANGAKNGLFEIILLPVSKYPKFYFDERRQLPTINVYIILGDTERQTRSCSEWRNVLGI